MSKKSRRRNKKILAALALAGGAAMLGRGRKGAGAVTGVPLNPNLQKTIAADAGSDIAAEVAAPADAAAVTSNFQSRNKVKGPDGNWRGAMEHKRYMSALPGAGVTAPPSILNPYNPYQNIGGGRLRRKGGGIAKRGTGVALKSGGRVTGIAKRGFGRALMKGKK